ncbi:MAG: hypothetical protein U0984_05485 [Prosthecobacter sp.]|nr:hypothetical protein [Prosthecobacter sp.]
MNTDPNINPYAPPASDVSPPALDKLPPMKRPASVKCALAFFAVMPLMSSWTYFLILPHLSEAGAVRMRQNLFIGGLVFLVLLLLLWFAGRRRFGYWTGVVGLFLITARAMITIPFGTNAVSAVPVLLLVTLLFYRFTFGSPSRLYYQKTVRIPTVYLTKGSKAPRPVQPRRR